MTIAEKVVIVFVDFSSVKGKSHSLRTVIKNKTQREKDGLC